MDCSVYARTQIVHLWQRDSDDQWAPVKTPGRRYFVSFFGPRDVIKISKKAPLWNIVSGYRKDSAMLTNKFAVNRSVLRVLVYGWEKDELPNFAFKFRPKAMGSFSEVVSKFSSEIHLLIIAEDSVDDATKKILSRGLYSKKDSCFYVEGGSIKDEFGLNGHSVDGNIKNIMIYGFEDKLEPEVVTIHRMPTNGTLKDVLSAPGFNYASAVVLESRPMVDDMAHYPGTKVVGSGDKARLQLLDKDLIAYLNKRALHVTTQNDFSYYILPFSAIQDMVKGRAIK
jgi:hypothetical protein